MAPPDPNAWALSAGSPPAADRNLQRLRPIALRIGVLRPEYSCELDEEASADDSVHLLVRRGDEVVARLVADAPTDDYFILYPFDDEDARYVSDADEAVALCDESRKFADALLMRRSSSKWWEFWKRW